MVHASKGFTLIEMVLVMMVVAILAAFAAFTYSDLVETGDASMVDASQAVLQAIVTTASVRMEVNPQALNATNVANAVRADLPERANINPGGGGYILTISNSNRQAVYQVGANGDVVLTSLSGFTDYNISPDGTIEKI